MAKKTKQRPAPEPEEMDEDVELLDDDEEETSPAKSKKGRKDDDVTFGAADLARLLTEKTGKTITPRELRAHIRKMARDGRVTREIIPGNKSRYNWSGPEDPEVRRIIKSVTSGELEEGKREALAALKERKAAKAASEAPAKKASKKAKAKAQPEPEEDEDLDEVEFDDDDE